MHRILNARAYLAFIISYAHATGFAVLHPLFHYSSHWLATAFGATILLAPAALSAACHNKMNAPDLFGIASGERRHTSLFALPVILIALYHGAIADYPQAVHDFDFAATLCVLGVVIALIGDALPLHPDDHGDSNRRL